MKSTQPKSDRKIRKRKQRPKIDSMLGVILPSEIWIRILFLLDERSTIRLSLVCQDLHNIVRGNVANWNYWQPLYAAKAYGDSHRIYHATGRSCNRVSSSKDESEARDFPRCHWDQEEDFLKGVKMIDELNLTGIWGIYGHHSTGHPYDYMMYLRQLGSKVYSITTQPFPSVGFGKLYCREPLFHDELIHHEQDDVNGHNQGGIETTETRESDESSNRLHIDIRRRNENDSDGQSEGSGLNQVDGERRPRVGSVSLRLRELRQERDNNTHGSENRNAVEGNTNNQLYHSNISPIDNVENGRLSRDETEPENQSDGELMDRRFLPLYLRGFGPWSLKWLLDFLYVDPEAVFLSQGIRWDWSNVCSAIVSIDAKKMGGTWIQEFTGMTLLGDENTGTFQGVRLTKYI